MVSRTAARLKLILTNITIEPAMFLITFSSSLDDVSVKQMLIEKSCRTDFQFNDTICDNLLLDEYKEENDAVQNEVRVAQGSLISGEQSKLGLLERENFLILNRLPSSMFGLIW